MRRTMARFANSLPCFLVLALSVVPARSTAEEPAAAREHFEKRIRPVLVRSCYECHSSALAEPKGGLRLDWRKGLVDGGDSGPAVVAGKPEESLLLQALRHDGLEMPPGKKLSDAVIADFAKWIEQGAVDPRDAPPAAKDVAGIVWDAQFAARKEWWSLQPVRRPVVPGGVEIETNATALDRFVLRALREKGLRRAPRADRAALYRRLSFVLTGLPPEADEVDAFVADPSPDAWPRAVDRMLESPHFGERFARHWMDAVRYGDTYGYEWDIPAKGAWRYRDYLVRAFNEDVPFDQLVREHIAGDLLEEPRVDPVEQINVSRLGTMFFQLGEKRHGDSSEFNGIHQEMLDNKIDAFSKAFQGMTISCARCHDHKLDAVAQREYYALAGVFMSSRWVTNTLDLPERDEALRRELKAIKAELRPILGRLWTADVAALSAETLRQQVKSRGDKPLPIEDFLAPWARLEAGVASGKSVAEAWRTVAAEYRTEKDRRAALNAGHFAFVADFRKGVPEGWSVDGVGLREIVPCGDFTVALEGDRAVGTVLLGGLVTNSLSPRMNGALRTPYSTLMPAGHLSFEVAGGDFSARRTVIDNAFLTEKQQYLNNALPAWQLSDTTASMAGRRNYIEFATKTSNPNFPPRVGLGGACSEEQAADPRSWFAISRVVRHVAPFPPSDELSRFTSLFEGDAPATIEEGAKRYRKWMDAAVDRWSASRAGDDDVRLLNETLAAGILGNRRERADVPAVQTLVDRYRGIEAKLANPTTANGMADLDPGYDYRLNVRGDYDVLGNSVPRGYVQALSASPYGFHASRSGRRELAELIASPDNPLTARVFVNRVWQWLFGQGLVRTADDFGHLGDLPSHPELLDWLAAEFVEGRGLRDEGRGTEKTTASEPAPSPSSPSTFNPPPSTFSIKRLVRQIVLSETWQQSGAVTDEARAADPDNRLLHHYPLRRLDAESLRDAILFASGRLEPRLYGPPVNPNRPQEDPQKRLFSGPVDGDGRRSIYTKVTIMEVPRFLATFNQPDPKIPIGTRDVSNTAAQSLALLNDPMVRGQSEHWAKRLVREKDSTPADRIERMFRVAYGRSPTPDELARWTAAVDSFAAAHQVAPADVMHNAAVWQDAAHALFNTKEMIYFR